METWASDMVSIEYKKVLTVPMRNGNGDENLRKYRGNKGSYRTYEEWKLPFLDYIKNIYIVLTVPMRNGNYRDNYTCQLCG